MNRVFCLCPLYLYYIKIQEGNIVIALIIIGVIGIVVIVAAGAVIHAVASVKSVVDPIIELTGNADLDDYIVEEGPKSVNAMTSIYLPRIEQDFPEFNYFEFRTKAENMIKSAFLAIEEGNITKLINASDELTRQVGNRIEYNSINHIREYFKDIEIHRTEIKNYKKKDGTCVITLQSSVGYTYYALDSNNETVKGDRDHTSQTRYDTDIIYIQDITKVEHGETLISNNCPNCGAPITGLGNKTCPYCGSGIKEINVKTWAINRLTEC